VKVFGRVARKTCATGLAVGTLYFLIIGALTVFGGIVTASIPPFLWFVLFVGKGALLGLLLGAAVAVTMTAFLPRVSRGGGDQRSRLRWAGAVTAGLPVLALTLAEQLTGVVGVLDPEVTTVVVIPTLVAAASGAAAAPGLFQRG
jgi:hypothetical protein